MALLVALSPIKLIRLASEIPAGILPIGIQEEIIKLIGQIVMMGHVILRASNWIILMKPAEQTLQPIKSLAEWLTAPSKLGDGTDFEEIEEGAFFDRQAAIHIGFADGKLRIQDETVVQGRLVQPDDDFRTIPLVNPMMAAMSIDDVQPPPSDDSLSQCRKQHPIKPSNIDHLL
ncbi:MAG: hypothetical protein OEU92_02645 [Alphaproteobacteria bacterium]|nr:hypothetical protein [Alphaproteobacteria bacterium]